MPQSAFASLSTAFFLAALGSCSSSCGGKAKSPPLVQQASGSGSAAAIVAPGIPAVVNNEPDLQPAPLTEGMAKPYFSESSGAAGAAAKAISLEQWKEAQKELLTFIASKPQPNDLARAQLLLGVSYETDKQWALAAATYGEASSALPLLADYIAYHRARCQYFAHDNAALATAKAVSPDSIHNADAQLLIGDIVRSGNNAQAIADHYRAYLARTGKLVRHSEARFRFAEASEQLAATNSKALEEAVEHYRLIAINDPLSSWATKASARLTAIAATAPEPLKTRIAERTIDEKLTTAMELFDGMRNAESEAAFTEVLAQPGISQEQACVASYNRAQSRFKARDRKQAKLFFDEAIAACKAAGNQDLEIKSNYQAGRSYAFVKEHETAIERYQAAGAIDAKHSYADDALLREAEEWASLGNDAKVREVLGSIPEKYPTGDMRAEAMWRLGFRSWKNNKYAEAITFWKKQIEVMPIDDNYYAEGQAQYWLGRAYLATKDKKAALASWRECIMTYPAAYYAMQALNRVREVAPKDYEKIIEEISNDPKGYDPKAPAFSFAPRKEWASRGFARAMELVRLGLGDTAAAELRKLGLAAPGNKLRVTDADQIEKLWAMSFLFDRAGNFGTSHWPTRWHILDYRRQWPVGANRARWNIAYPKGYWQLLTTHAKTNEVPIAMQIAIVREESAFDPLLESYANAVGLTQMIFPTAERFAKGTGLTVSRETLRNPESNVTIGSRFLGFLFKQWDNFTLLVPPSYNAGEGGVKKMLKVRGTWDADEFIEGIVDDQARNYSKRVLGTFFTYTWLYEQKVPEMPLTIPAALLKK